MRKPSNKKEILTIESLEKFERVINRDFKPYDINLMVMPGTLEDKHKNCETIPALRRQFNLIYLFLGGEHDVKLGADQTMLSPNDLVIVPENMLYASDHIKGCTGYCIHFKTEFLQPLLSKTLSAEFAFFNFDAVHIVNLSSNESQIISQSFKDILAEYERYSPERDYILRNYILILLLRIREVYSKHVDKLSTAFTRSQQLAIRFKHLVEKHFIEMRTVGSYADKLNITAKYLSDIAQQEFGRGPLEMIHDMIFLEAKALLRSTDKSVAEIAHQLQFQDQSHFSHFIKKRAGLTPLQLRKKL